MPQTLDAPSALRKPVTDLTLREMVIELHHSPNPENKGKAHSLTDIARIAGASPGWTDYVLKKPSGAQVRTSKYITPLREYLTNLRRQQEAVGILDATAPATQFDPPTAPVNGRQSDYAKRAALVVPAKASPPPVERLDIAPTNPGERRSVAEYNANLDAAAQSAPAPTPAPMPAPTRAVASPTPAPSVDPAADLPWYMDVEEAALRITDEIAVLERAATKAPPYASSGLLDACNIFMTGLQKLER